MSLFSFGKTLRFRIFRSILAALIPVLLLLAVVVELILVPYITADIERELTNATRMLTNSVRAGAALAIRNHLRAIAEKNLEIARQHLYLVERQQLSRSEAIARVSQILLSQRVGSSGYLYCLQADGVLAVHPNRDLVGVNISSFSFASEQMDKKTGYIEYDWQNPGETEQRPKALYMSYLEELDWIISASSYRSEFSELLNPDDFDEVVRALRFGTSGYAYMFDDQGTLLIHPKLVDYNFFLQQEMTVEFVRTMIREGSGHLQHEWRNPDESRPRQKIVVYERIPEYGWVIASSAYLDEVMAPVRIARLTVHGAIIFLLLTVGLVSYGVSGRLTRSLRTMVQQLDRNKRSGQAAPLAVYDDDEIGRLAAEFNSFLQTVQAQTAEIRTTEERYRSLFEVSPDAVFLLEGMQLVDCNPATLSLFGGRREDIVGLQIDELSPPEQPSGKASREQALQLLKQVADHPLQTFLWVHRRLDGTLFDAEVRLKHFSYETERSVVIAFVRDITERKRAEEALRESEEKYRQLVEHAHDAIFIAQDGRVVFANPQSSIMLGYTDAELKGRSFVAFIHPDDQALVIDRHTRRLQGDPDLPQRYQFRLLTKESSELSVELSAVLIQWNGRPATLNFARDITEQKRLEYAFHQAQKMEAIGTLAGGIAHDFNNLLMGIQGRAALLQIGGSDRQFEHARAIEDYVKSAGGLTRQLLGFARGGKYQPRPVDLRWLVRTSSELFGRTKKEIGIILEQDTVPVVAEVDKSQLEQVLLNMYVNAWQAMPQGGELRITTRSELLDAASCTPHQVEPGHYAVVAVSDTGIGIDETIHRRIFEPFFSTKEKGRGTGLGLASAYGIVRNHGGFITLDSEIGRGATFVVHLPLSDKEPVFDDDDHNTEPGVETVLLVDDETMILEVGRAMLEQLGYRVLTAQGGMAALTVMKEQGAGIDLIILDLVMPGMDGSQTLEQIRAAGCTTPVIFSSGYALDFQMERLVAGDSDGFLQKPFSLAELSKYMRSVLAKQQHHDKKQTRGRSDRQPSQ